MRPFLLLVFGLLGSWGAGAQPQGLARQYAAAIASIQATQANGNGEVGSGFVVGSTPDSVYLVTAAHVLGEARAAVRVKLEGIAQFLPAKVLFFNYSAPEDLALLAVAARQFRWPRYSTRAGLGTEDSICFIHTQLTTQDDNSLLSEKTLLPTNSEAFLVGTNQETNTLHIVLDGVVGGDSGSALLLAGNSLCVVGMLIKTDFALSIAHVKEVLLPRLGKKWQLLELPPKTE